MNFTLCKNRCNYTKRNKQSRNSPLSVQPFQNRTIPCFAPSRSPFVMPTSVCACLLCIYTIPLAFRRGAGLPLPLHRPSPSPQPSQKDNNPSLRPNLPKPHYLSKSTISLPPLSKGGGLTARRKLLLVAF